MDNELMTITRVQPSIRDGVDTERLKSMYPEVYDEVRKITPIKGGIRTKLKTKQNLL